VTDTDETAPERDEPAIIAERRAKLTRLRESGVDPFPHDFPDRVEIATVRAAHDGLEDGEETDS
jgi:lysyl-tRNA synthetase class 2